MTTNADERISPRADDPAAHRNPFVVESPIQDLQRFFDRESITRGIMSRLQTLQDSSIIGERRMGKTSLLYHLSEPEVALRYGIDPKAYVFVYFSFANSAQLTPTRFWQRLLQLLLDRIADADLRLRIDSVRTQTDIDPLEIQDLFQDIHATGLRVVFLLDEFETVTLAESLNADFFSHLRSLAIGRYIGLVFVTSSRQKLSELSHAGIVGSPFFNIFETYYLTPFDDDAARGVIEASLANSGVDFIDQEIQYLLTLSGRHPFFLQMGASYLFDAYTVQRLSGSRLSAARLERVEREFLQKSAPHLAHYWSQSTDEERMFLASVAVLSQARERSNGVEMEEVRGAYRDADVTAKLLRDRGLVLNESARYQILSPAYERWIVSELTRDSGSSNYAVWLGTNGPPSGGALNVVKERYADLSCVNPEYYRLVTDLLVGARQPDRLVDLIVRGSRSSEVRPIWLDFVEA